MKLNRIARWAVPAVLGLLPAFASAENKSFVEKIPNSTVEFKMIHCPAGAVEVKVAKDAEPVKVEVKPFYIGEHEVSWEEFDIFAFGLDLTEKEKLEAIAKTRPSKPYGPPDHGFGHNGYACLSMTFKSAKIYTEWLSAKTGKKYRLPTEAEWTYACQAGQGYKKFTPEELDKMAWFADNAKTEEAADGKTHPIKKKAPNEWGLYDMLGNAMEWCVGLDGKPVAKGGSYRTTAAALDSNTRNLQTPAWNVTDPQDPKSTWWLSDGKHISIRVVCDE
jgi:formylglycine-generating enzyme required for sulfatase activity